MSCPTTPIVHDPPRRNKRHRIVFVEWVTSTIRDQGTPLPAKPSYAELMAALRKHGLRPERCA